METVSNDLDCNNSRYIIEHVFLPAKPPECADPNIPSKDAALLAEVSKAAVTFRDSLHDSRELEDKPAQAWKILCEMLKAMQAIAPAGVLLKSNLENGLRSMKVGGVLPIYVSSQNAGIIFRKRSAEELTFEAFEISLPYEAIMGTVGKVVVQYPVNRRLAVSPDESLLSTLANTISFLDSRKIDEVNGVLSHEGYKEKVRVPANPRYITEALAGFLRGVGLESNSNGVDDATVFIKKRIDDHVVRGVGTTQPWRRSSMWLLIRVSLQTTLEELGVTRSEGYKAFQAYFLAHLLEKCTSKFDLEIVPDDVIEAMNRKLARRMWKMKELVDSRPSPIFDFSSRVIKKVSKALGDRWEETRKRCVSSIQWSAPTQDAIKKDLEHSLQVNQHYIRSIIERTQQLATIGSQYDDAAFTRTLSGAPRLDLLSKELPPKLDPTIDKERLDTALIDFEFWVETRLSNWTKLALLRRSPSDCGVLLSALEDYTQRSLEHYAKSPERISICWLTVAELWVSLDQLVLLLIPLMKRFSPEIPYNLLEPLLLPSAAHLQRMNHIQLYIHDRDAESDALSVFEDINSPESFQNIYFKDSREMQEAKKTIEQWGLAEQEVRKQERIKANDNYNALVAKVDSLSCEYYLRQSRHGYEDWEHSVTCKKCALQSEAENLQTTRFEEPLPSDPFQANALVFELNCPETFGLWREATYQILLRAFSYSADSNEQLYELAEYAPINRFHHSQNRRITIASSVASVAMSLQGHPCRLHATLESVLLPHSGQYSLTYNGSWLQTRGESVLRRSCTLPLDEPYVYNLFGTFIENTTHEPNTVIASQTKCPPGINLAEYMAFGHLRSGNGLQLRNIMRALISQSLPFNNPGIHSLIMQAIWQAGPTTHPQRRESEPPNWYRDAHQDLSERRFAEGMLSILEGSLKKVGESGQGVFYLATLVALATRLLSLSGPPDVGDRCLSFLQAARGKAFSWMALVKTEIAVNTNDDSGRLQQKLALIAAVWRLTFDVDSELLETLCGSDGNTAGLISAQMTIAFNKNSPQPLSNAAQLLLRRDKHLAYRLEPHIAKVLEYANPESPLDTAVNQIREAYESGLKWRRHGHGWWKQEPPRTTGGRLLKSTADSKGDVALFVVCVNILTGEMRVDGRTVGRLPPDYVEHATYQEIFGKNATLQSYPSTLHGMKYEATYRGTQFHFAMVEASLIVRVCRGAAVEEYVPSSKLREDISSSFPQKHHYWYVEEEGRKAIEFRPVNSSWSTETHKDWVLELKDTASGVRGLLHKTSSLGVQRALDPHSSSFELLHGALKGVEPFPLDMRAVVTEPLPRDMSTANHPKPPLLNITLVNHNLDFFLNESGILESRSFPQYVLEPTQDIGCLYGLVSCIVLCDKSASQRVRKVIVPRGRIVAAKTHHRHPIIQVETVKGTGFYVYDVDQLVGRLLGSGSMESDLFLVQLHAFTSSHCPDPLTNRTGTEEALACLGGASMLSHHVPSDRWRVMMQEVAAISPRREYWGTAIEQIKWQGNLPAASQHAGFKSQITNILLYWSNIHLQEWALECSKPLEPGPVMTTLNLRAAVRDLRSTQSHSPLRKQDEYDHDYTYMQSPESRKREASAYQVAYCAHHPAVGLPITHNLREMLGRQNQFGPTQNWDWMDFSQWFSGKLSSLWPTLYRLCCLASQNRESPRYNIAMTFSILAYRDSVPMPLLGTLMAIVRDPEFQHREFQHHLESGLDMRLGAEFDEVKVHDYIRASQSEESKARNARGLGPSEEGHSKETYDDLVIQDVDQATAELRRRWAYVPTRHSDLILSATPRLPGLERLIQNTLQPLFNNWVENKAFLDHLDVVNKRILQLNETDEVVLPVYQPGPPLFRTIRSLIEDVTIEILMRRREGKIKDLPDIVATMSISGQQQPPSIRNYKPPNLRSLVEPLNSVPDAQIEGRYREQFTESVKAFEESPSLAFLEAKIPPEETLNSQKLLQEKRHADIHEQVVKLLLPVSRAEELLLHSGLWPRLTTAALLQTLSLQQRCRNPPSWREAISLYANSLISVQRSRRLFYYGAQKMSLDYTREIHHGRLRSSSHPDWLLVEIEADICIRSDQVDVAKTMIDPPNSANTIVQLNMGEGKSSVIVPIVAAELANTKQLVRVVVLKPQSKLQLSLLRARLARLANRRVICLPFDRDIKTNTEKAEQISGILETCCADGAIWLCQPEHLLSFKLLGLDLAMGGSSDIGSKLIKCQLWIEENTRDILDESDEILHTRHQLMYTIGPQGNFDAAPMRWEVVEQFLSLLQSQLTQYPNPHFLVLPPLNPGPFVGIQMLSEEGSEVFHQLAWKIVFKAAIPSISMTKFPSRLKKAAMRLLTQRELPADTSYINSLREYCKMRANSRLWQSLLIIRGLIAFNVLTFCFRNQRWRVDYGHDFRRSRLAVPYLAKDSPSLRSDFAHPEVLVLLTCLTYYYSGLGDEMIVSTVKELLKMDSPELIYAQWISSYKGVIPEGSNKLSDVDSDNNDTIVRSLGPLLRQNKPAIDFYLNQCVFPNYAKNFPFKLSASAWDLAMKKAKPTTGFSGTNDSQFLLPTSINQVDLPAQRHTNATALAYLLQKENATVVRYENHLNTGQILDEILGLEPRPTVLLDVGAQILDYYNEDLVKVWLSKCKEDDSIKAAVFFDGDDNLCIMERDHSVQLFADSPYNSRLDECLVYLDDSHTRGTDLRLPKCRAAVTLGKRLPKDKLVQGMCCMRMRKLGSLHSLVFLARDDVIGEIRRATKETEATIVSSHVLQWAITETCRQLHMGVANWATQGYEFVARKAGWSQMTKQAKTAEQIKELFCQESLTLDELYGIGESQTARERVGYTWSNFHDTEIIASIDRHCKLFESFSFDDARYKDAQEVELVREQKVEKEVKHPSTVMPAPHSCHPNLLHFVENGWVPRQSQAFLTIEYALAHIPLGLPAGANSIFSNIMVTDDFCHTILQADIHSPTNIGGFLRPVEWVVTSRIKGRGEEASSLVIISPFEANKLLHNLRKSTNVSGKLHLFTPRTSLDMWPLEELSPFALPTTTTEPLHDSLAWRLDLFAGTLYLREFGSYTNLCSRLRVYFGDTSVYNDDINPNGFVKGKVRDKLGLYHRGFEEDPIPFLRTLFNLRSNGRSFCSSHMGQILNGVGLTESSFPSPAPGQ